MPKELLAPLPGSFIASRLRTSRLYKSEGDIVAVGDVVGLIEVMKSFIEVHAEASGKIIRFVVGDEEPIMAGQSLLEIE